MAEKVQTGFYQRWRDTEIQATYTADQVLDDVIEYVKVDTTSNTVKITLPDITSAEIVNGKQIWVFDSGNAATNAVEIVPDPTDGTTIEGLTNAFIEEDNGAIIFELLDKVWMIIANADRFSRAIGAFSMLNNATATVINTVNVYEDIAGTAIGAAGNSKFDFTTSPNRLTYVGSVDITVFGIVTVGARRDSGAAVRLARFTAFKNGTEIPAATATIDITNRLRNSTFPIFTELVTDDEVDVQVRNEDDTSDILVEDLNMVVFEINS